MRRKHDWNAVAREVNDYLDQLEQYQRPMQHGTWATVLGIDWKVLDKRARKHPDGEWAKALGRHKAIDAAWLCDFFDAVQQANGRRGYVKELAIKFHLTPEQARQLVDASRAKGRIPKVGRRGITASQFVDVAEVGMTRRELAAAAGVNLVTVEKYLSRAKTHEVNSELRRRIIWVPGGPNVPSRIKAVRRVP